MITKDGRDLPIESLTPDNYLVPAGEEKSYHCVIEVVQYNQKTGDKISRPRVQKFGKKIFESVVESSLRKQGYKVIILHDPNDWLKEQAAKRAENAKAKAKAEQEKFDAAVAAAVAKEMAKQKGKTTDAPDYDADAPEYAKKGRKGNKE